VDVQGTVYAATTSGLLVSFENGDTWSQRNSGLSSVNAWALAFNENGALFIGTKEGVFRSPDKGRTWQSVGNELPNQYVRSLFIDSDGFLFVGTNGGGIYRSIKSTLQ
jgi:ligand-binding sensor domain-containing protein